MLIEMTYSDHTFTAVFVYAVKRCISLSEFMYRHTLIPVLISHLFVWDTVIYMVMLNDPSHLLRFHLSCFCMVETNQWASAEGAQIRLFKWIGHYTGDAWGYRQKNAITWYLPAFLFSNHPFCFYSTLSAGIHFLPPQSWQITRGKSKSCPGIISMEIALVTVFKPLVEPHLWVSVWHCEPKYMSKGNKSEGEG